MYSNPNPNSDLDYHINGSWISGVPMDGKIWPQYTIAQPVQLDFNLTGGSVINTYSAELGLDLPVTIGNATTSIYLNNATAWEGDRGSRCDLWRRIGKDVPN